jgi:hypothetical protein
MRKLFLVSVIFCFIFLIGCKEESTSPKSEPPSIPTVTFSGPTANETHAQTANSYAESMTGLLSAGTAFAYLPASQNGNVTSWSISAAGFTQTFSCTKQGDGSYSWSYVLNGSDGFQTYSNWTMWTGTTSADGKSGSWIFYEFGQASKVQDLVYSTDGNGVMTGTWQMYNTSGAVTGKFIIINRPDGSGEFDRYFDGTRLDLKVTWTSNGTGTWTTYASGTQTGNGTF